MNWLAAAKHSNNLKKFRKKYVLLLQYELFLELQQYSLTGT